MLKGNYIFAMYNFLFDHMQALCFIIRIFAAVTLSTLEDLNDNIDTINNRNNREVINYDDSDDYEAAAGWLVFVAVMGMIIESLIIFLRILNISFINQNFLIFGIVVSKYNVLVIQLQGKDDFSVQRNSHKFYNFSIKHYSYNYSVILRFIL